MLLTRTQDAPSVWAVRRGWSGPRRRGIDDEDAVWVVFNSHEEVSSYWAVLVLCCFARAPQRKDKHGHARSRPDDLVDACMRAGCPGVSHYCLALLRDFGLHSRSV